MTDAALARGYAECTRLTRAYGTTYYWGALLLPRPRRRHVHAVYALCRLADDIVHNRLFVDHAATRAALGLAQRPLEPQIRASVRASYPGRAR